MSLPFCVRGCPCAVSPWVDPSRLGNRPVAPPVFGKVEFHSIACMSRVARSFAGSRSGRIGREFGAGPGQGESVVTTPLGVQERLDRRRRASKLVGGKNLATGPGRDGLEDAEVDQLLDESNTAVGEQEVGATGMKPPVLVAMSEARGGVRPVSFAGVREDERPASFGVEAR